MKFIILAGLLASAGAMFSAEASAASIVIAHGRGPVDSYLDLAIFGASALNVGADSFVTIATPAVAFAGKSWSTINIGENGLVSLGSGGSDDLWSAVNSPLPSGYATPILAPLWTDVDATGGAIRSASLTDGTNAWTVVDWSNVLVSGVRASFQIWIGQGREHITYSYASLGRPARFTIGAQDASGTTGTSYRFNDGTLPSHSELRVTSAGLPVQGAVPEPATWAMMVVGFGLAGGMIRRRKVNVPVAHA